MMGVSLDSSFPVQLGTEWDFVAVTYAISKSKSARGFGPSFLTELKPNKARVPTA